MTTLREAAKLALEVLENLDVYGEYTKNATVRELRKVLAEPAPEPVAWMVYTLDGTSAFVTDNPADFTQDHRALPLYTSPPQRKPLTDEEIVQISDLRGGCYGTTDFARAIEKAHGIGEKR